jgi:catalase (peroxidase I)
MSNPSAEAKCPFHAAGGARATHGAQSVADWWPTQLNLSILHQQQPVTRADDATADDLDHLAALGRGALHAAQRPGQEEDQPHHQQQAKHHLRQLPTQAARRSGRRRSRAGCRRGGGDGQVADQ